jgi:hypothetical protein
VTNVLNRLVDADRARSRRWGHEMSCGLELTGWVAVAGRGGGEEGREARIVRYGRALLPLAWTAEERAFVRAVVAGEPREAWVAAPGVADRPPTEQQAAIRLVTKRLHERGMDSRRRAGGAARPR